VRSSDESPTVCFLAGGGTNNDFPNYSAYCVAKILLIKLMGLLQSEEPSSKFVIIRPGYVNTPIHDETISAGNTAGKNHERTKQLLRGPVTSLENYSSQNFGWVDMNCSTSAVLTAWCGPGPIMVLSIRLQRAQQ